jgi:thiamine kinase-like enzyme
MGAGMTNTSFTVRIGGESYVVRLPGRGTEALINRREEREAYRALEPFDLTDEVVAVDKEGRRVTVFYEDARVADPADDQDLATSMGIVRRLHGLEIPLTHRFAFGAQVDRYERLTRGLGPAPFPRIEDQPAWARELLRFRRDLQVPEVFCHCDLNADNILIRPGGEARLIDWEYSGRADPMMDVAMFAMYSFLGRERVEFALRLYLQREPLANEEARCYLYLALSGYLWSMWARYRESQGEDFGDYGPKTNAYLQEYHAALHEGDLMARALTQTHDAARAAAPSPGAPAASLGTRA